MMKMPAQQLVVGAAAGRQAGPPLISQQPEGERSARRTRQHW